MEDKSIAVSKKIGLAILIVVATGVAQVLQDSIPQIQEITPDWLDGIIAMVVPIVVTALLTFARTNHKDAVEEALHTPVPEDKK